MNLIKIHGIATVRDFIANTCVNVLKRLLCDPKHPLTIKLSRNIVRENRSSFKFEYPKAKNEAYNNSIVPWGIRLLRDGQEDLYKSAAISLKRAAKKNRPASILSYQPRVPATIAKPKTSCKFCGGEFEAIRGIKIHQRKCPSKA